MLKAGLKAGLVGGVVMGILFLLGLASNDLFACFLLILLLLSWVGLGFLAARLGGNSLSTGRANAGAGAIAATMAALIYGLLVSIQLATGLSSINIQELTSQATPQQLEQLEALEEQGISPETAIQVGMGVVFFSCLFIAPLLAAILGALGGLLGGGVLGWTKPSKTAPPAIQGPGKA